MGDYSSHQKYLLKELASLPDKAILLELGVGEGSSSLVHDYCKNNPNSKAYAFESDEIWFNKMKSKYELENYIFKYIQDWGELLKYINHEIINMAFIDQAPWEARIVTINLLKNNTDIFIVHDYDYYNMGYPNLRINNEKSWWGQNYSEQFTLEDNYEILPPTLIMRKIKI